MRRAALRFLSLLGIALMIPACSSGSGGGGIANFDYYVHATAGNDANPGSIGLPFKTIAQALSIVLSGQTIKVFPGTYDAANGETFPLTLPAGATLIGNEPNKGNAPTRTAVLGGDTLGATLLNATFDLGANSVIAGFVLTNTSVVAGSRYAIVAGADGVTIRNNSIIDGAPLNSNGVYVWSGAQNGSITGNLFDNNDLGLGFINGGVGFLVENNVVTNNGIGVEYDSPGGDMGGGAAGSTGGNVLSCNTQSDLWTNSGVTINAQNNSWDNLPPSIGSGGGSDIFNGYDAQIDSTGALLAPTACPDRTFYVDAAGGNDGNTGGIGDPFKTITFALTQVDGGDTIFVNPGTYDAANGETFPLSIPVGINLIGDEPNKGGGGTPTQILGGDLVAGEVFGATIIGGRHARIAGFTITNTNGGLAFPYAVALNTRGARFRNNRIVNSYGGVINYGTSPHQLTFLDNIITGHTTSGIELPAGGFDTRIEGNEITGNATGIILTVSGTDLGGGVRNSAGGNILSCNTTNDVVTPNAITVMAQNNLWDHLVPTTGTGGGNDFDDGGAGATLDATGAALSPAPCP